jgi:YtxH-like protein
MDLQDITNKLSPQEIAKLFRPEPSFWRTESFSGSLALLGAGALIGATVALFFAPKSGAELRRDVSDKLGAAGDKAAEATGASTVPRA